MRRKILTLSGAVALGVVLGALILALLVKSNIIPLPKQLDYIRYARLHEEDGAVKFRNTSYFSPDVSFVDAAKITTPTVVHVKTMMEGHVEKYNQPFESPFFRFEFPYDNYIPPQRGSGSGVIISENGYIITNNHVVDDADKIMVTLDDKREFKAKVIGTDPNTDLAVIKIETGGLPFIKYGNSDAMQVGDWVLAVGNPFDLTSTVTAGIISAKGRNLRLIRKDYSIESFIQTDAAINPGNSGGALVNLNGELIGINTAIASNNGQYAGYGFAVPVNLVRKVIEDIMKFGEVQRAFIGVQIGDVTSEVAEQMKLDKVEGVIVKGLTENGAAKEAGIKENDVILSISGTKVNSVSHLQEVVGQHRPGDKVMLLVRRDGKEMEIPVTLKNRMGNTDVVTKNSASMEELKDFLGASFKDATSAIKSEYGITGGVVVTDIRRGGRLADKGVPEGFVITKVNDESVSNADEFFDMISKSKGRVIIEGYTSGGRKEYYAIGLEK